MKDPKKYQYLKDEKKKEEEKKPAVTFPKPLPAGVEPGFVYVNDSVFFSQYSVG
jgi:hypothetical protein